MFIQFHSQVFLKWLENKTEDLASPCIEPTQMFELQFAGAAKQYR